MTRTGWQWDIGSPSWVTTGATGGYLAPTTGQLGRVNMYTSTTPIAVVRIITRLNIGGPSIQATRLTNALEHEGLRTTLLHGRLGEGEGDMSYLIAPGSRAIYVATLCRPLSPLDDLRTLFRLYREIKRVGPAIVHTHMAKAGLLGRLAAALHNLTRGRAPAA